jgi:prevent-host-death family protein
MYTNGMITIPVSRFRREFRKWIKYVENTNQPVIISTRNQGDYVFVPVSLLVELMEN